MSRVGRERGEGAISYIGVILLVTVVGGALVAGGAPKHVAAACETAVCKVFGQNCPVRQEAADTGGSGGSGGGTGGGMEEPSPLNSPPRSPIPKPTCTPDSDAEWVEGLHSHNDYENNHPLKDALDHGATSVELDIWDENGELRLQHQADGGSRGTLRGTYVDPLIKRAAENGGQVYKGRDKPFVLLIEVKRGGPETYQKIFEQTRDLPPGVQLLMDGGALDGALVGKQPPNVSFYITPGEGCTLPPKVDPSSPHYDREYAKNFTMLNGSYHNCADRDHDGKISAEEQRKLNEIVQKAHAAGLKVRFVEGPDGRKRDHKDAGGFKTCPWRPGRQGCEKSVQEEWWKAQREAGVDYLDTAHLNAGEKWLRKCGQ